MDYSYDCKVELRETLKTKQIFLRGLNMKTTKTLRTVICAALAMVVGCANLVAQPNSNEKKPTNIVQTLKHQPPVENEALRTISGKIDTFTKFGTKYITIVSPSKKVYIINIDNFAREQFQKLPGNAENFTEDNIVTVQYLLDNVGKKVVLTGIVNRENGIFSVVKTGTIPRPQSSVQAVDAK